MKNAGLPDKEKMLLDGFIKKLKKIYTSDLISAILYGSAASGEFSDKHSNVNLLIVLKDTGLIALSKASSLVRLRRYRTINPIFFTETYINASTDTFPIEFLDMKENYSVIFGKDVLKDLRIDTRNLRFQCEQELKSKLIFIKHRYLLTSSQKELEQLLFKSFTSCIHVLRNILRLKGKEPPYLKCEVLSETEKELSVDTTVLNEILWAKTKNMKLNHADVDALLIGFVKELEVITGVVDAL
jgi:predicted nucleotidyltransferase